MTTDAQADTPAPDTTPAVPAAPAAIAARDAELTALFESDPNRYSYEDGGKFANEHLALRQAQQRKSGEQDGAEKVEGDDLADVDVSAIDLNGEETGEGEGGSETSVKPIGPGDDATDEELADWRTEHGVPDDP